jgi:hypothetical protein
VAQVAPIGKFFPPGLPDCFGFRAFARFQIPGEETHRLSSLGAVANTLVMLASQCVLLSDGTIPVDTAAFKESVLYHAVAKQQEEDR